MKKKPPCRINLIHAAAAPVAVVLRHGPGDWTHLALLDTQTDILTHGAWFNGRVYENSCDLSPDGELFLYKALPSIKTVRAKHAKNAKGAKGAKNELSEIPSGDEAELRGAWTAISRPPWLVPLARWSHGNAWDGGGYFTEPRKLTILSRHEIQSERPQSLFDLPEELDVSFQYDKPHAGAPSVSACCRDLDGNLISARDGKIFRQIKWQCGKEVEIADLTRLQPPKNK